MIQKIKIRKQKIFSKVILVVFATTFLLPNIAWGVEYNFDAANKEIWQINQDINNKRASITELKRQVEVYQKNIKTKQKELTNLSSQVASLDNSIAKINLEVQSLELEKETTDLKIKNTELQIKGKEAEIATQKENIAETLRGLHREQQKTGILEMLLLNDRFSDFISELDRLESLQDGLLENVKELEKMKNSLVDDRNSLETNKNELVILGERLESKKDLLGGQKEVKYYLLEKTHGQEAKFQQLLAQAKAEQAQIDADIQYLEKIAREKLNRKLQSGELKSEGLIWPVPSQIVTAYFHDPDYPYRYIFEHPAIDIRAAQGTPIKAAESGYVAKTKDGGQYGYSYIMLVHADGLSTVYGHVNIISVAEDQFVTQGQIIGYSGGMPGTKGAGPFTSGPHLHFETRVNGIPVNPLNYLN